MSNSESLATLRSGAPMVLPSMLLCDFGNLEKEMERLEAAGAQAYHLDVMDGVFVPNFTYGMPIVSAVRRLTKRPLDVHLMMVEPQKYVRQFVDAGADLLTFHAEAVDDLSGTIRAIKDAGAAAGVAVNPSSSLERVLPVVDECDLILVMSVEAGFGGQSFQPVALEKIAQLREHATTELLIQVDGGINQETIASCAKAGADLFVVGSGIFAAEDYERAISQLTALAS